MPQFLTDPSITLRGLREPESPWDILSRFAQLQQLQQAGRLNRLNEEEANLRLEQLRRLEGDKSAMRTATAAGVRPGFTMPAGGADDAALMTDVQVPPRFDRQAALASVAGGPSAHLFPKMQQEFALSDEAMATAKAETQKALAGKSKAELDIIEKGMDIFASAAMAVINADPQIQPGLYKQFVQSFAASSHPVLQALAQKAPPEFSPEILPMLQANAMQALTVKEQVELQRGRGDLTKTIVVSDKVMQWNPKTEKYDIEVGKKPSQLKSPEEEAQLKRIAAVGKPGIVDVGETPADPESSSILAQTGLSLRGFMALTGRTTQLPRDAATRNAAMKEAQEWANKKGVDVSTLASQYQTYNDVLSQNISRMNRTKIMEDELIGTIENLQGVVKEKDLSRIRFANVAKIWAGQEVNDDLAQQYAMHLYQLRNELAAYGAATQGRSGNEITLQDMREAEETIKRGIAQGSLAGLRTAVENSTTKMGQVMQRSVHAARKAIWELFGVGQNYKGAGRTPTGARPPDEQGGLVHMVGPDGSEKMVPVDKVAAAEAAGAKRKQ